MHILLVTLSLLGTPEAGVEDLELFEKRIRPVLVEKCYGCHAKQAGLPKGGLRLDTRATLRRGGKSGAVLVPGSPQESRLLSALRYQGDLRMPPEGKLPERVAADFEEWIRRGAPDPREDDAVVGSAAGTQRRVDFAKAGNHWSLRLPELPPTPPVKDSAWPRNRVDRFVLARLEEEGLRPVGTADRHQLIRRVSFDLVGLPPTIDEINAFVADTAANAYEKLVDRLLASPHYGERWGRRWLDVARYAEDQAHTFRARRYPNGFRYRDWVIEALNADLPYDRFVAEQIAADLLPASSPEAPERLARLPALGFFALGPVYYRDDKESTLQAMADDLEDRVDTLGRGLLGLSLACARCHDHKYDPVTTQDYYAVAGVFNSSKYDQPALVPQSVVDAHAAAAARLKKHEQALGEFLTGHTRRLRHELVPFVGEGLVATLEVDALRQAKDGTGSIKDAKEDPIEIVAAQKKLSPALIRRFEQVLQKRSSPTNVLLGEWNEAFRKDGAATAFATNGRFTEGYLAKARQLATQIQAKLESLTTRRDELFGHWGERIAFVPPENRSVVVPGEARLGNLFDPGVHGESLSAALVHDPDRAVAASASPWVERVVHGFTAPLEIAPGLRFDFTPLGADGSKHGKVTNDGWSTEGSIQTRGKKIDAKSARIEDGIGIHANALVTFDLVALRDAAGLPADQALTFVADRAGINDDVFGDSGASVHLAVLVATAGDAPTIRGLQINGVAAGIREQDAVSTPTGTFPVPLRADGKFVTFRVEIPPDAAWLTLAATGAGTGSDKNTVHGDHAVFSGARIEYASAPPPPPAVEAATFADALVLSELLAEGSGLLWLGQGPVGESLQGQAATRLEELRNTQTALKKEVAALTIPRAHGLADGAAADLRLNIRGDPTQLGEVIPRGYLTALSGPEQRARGKPLVFNSSGSGRLELARSIASEKNPLTARVMVNRVWQGHFGRGLVRTASNFGVLGERPTHPKLLDYLAVRLMTEDWSLKTLHREILLSATYRLSNTLSEEGLATDPDNRLLWRAPRRRLEVEPWRDAMLAVTGGLLSTIGGPSFHLDRGHSPRRTLYAHISRHQLDDLLRLFDFPDPNITSAERSRTTVPLQQLFVLNSEFMKIQAAALAKAILELPVRTKEERIRHVFLRLFSRPPRAWELVQGAAFLEVSPTASADGEASVTEHAAPSAWEKYALVLLGTNEFLYVD